MIYGYIRVSTDKQTTENQRFALLKYADEKHLHVDQWIEETVSSTRALTERKLGTLIETMHSGDTLLVSELSRLGRSLMEARSNETLRFDT
jgi:putative DNA-invertase from lambdoid prophage Rac